MIVCSTFPEFALFLCNQFAFDLEGGRRGRDEGKGGGGGEREEGEGGGDGLGIYLKINKKKFESMKPVIKIKK